MTLFLLILSIMCSSEKYIHPDFMITHDILAALLKDKMNQSFYKNMRETILAYPKEFLESMKIILALPPELLLLVDKEHGLDSSYEPDDLVELSNYSLEMTKKSLSLRHIVMDDLLSMMKAADQDGVRLIIASAYRSYSYQAQVYDYWVKELGREQADRESARPGHSQHQLGTTLDFYPIEDDFVDTEAGKWVLSRAQEFGFSLSYPEGYEEVSGYKYEPWHYRYIGMEPVKMINRYFLGIQQYFLDFFHENAEFFRRYLKKEQVNPE